jgi:hypothetical protein
LIGHGILASALLWASVRVGTSFADYFYAGRLPATIAPIEFAGYDDTKVPDGQAMASYAAGILHQVQSQAAEIRKLSAVIDDPQFQPWVGTSDEQTKLYKIIKLSVSYAPRLSDGDASGLVGLVEAAPQKEVKVQVEGTDISPLLSWAMKFLAGHGTLGVQLTKLKDNSWHAVYNIDASGFESAAFEMKNIDGGARAATEAFSWEYARRQTTGYTKLPALQRMRLDEYQVFLGVYSGFASAINDAYHALDKSSTFEPDELRFSELLDEAIGIKFNKYPQPCPTQSASPPPEGPSKPTLFAASCNWTELSQFIATLSKLAGKNETASFFSNQAAGLELQRNTCVPEGSQIPSGVGYRTETKPDGDSATYGLITEKSPFASKTSATTGRVKEFPAGHDKVLVAEASNSVIDAAYALQDILSRSGANANTVVLDLNSQLFDQPALRYLLNDAIKNGGRRIIRTTKAGGKQEARWSSPEAFVAAAVNGVDPDPQDTKTCPKPDAKSLT